MEKINYVIGEKQCMNILNIGDMMINYRNHARQEIMYMINMFKGSLVRP